MVGRHWTPEDEELLISEWKRTTIRKLADMFDVSTNSIRSKARCMRKEGKYLPHKRQKWFAFEDQTLIRLRKTETDVEIATALNRTVGSIRCRALKLRKWGFDINHTVRNPEYPRAGSPWTSDDTTYFLTHINANGIEAMSEALQRTPLAIACRVRKLQDEHAMDPEVVKVAENMLAAFKEYQEQKGVDTE